MTATLTLRSPAKINRFLHICGRREDGYHNLQTVFQFLDLADLMHFKARDDEQIHLTPVFEGLAPSDNLIVRAARLLQNYALENGLATCSLGADIHIEKFLPMGGGIGGGSSNAATSLLALNQLWGLFISHEKLAELGLQLGADVPIFIHGHSAWAEGVGEHIQPIKLDESWAILAVPDCHVSTAEIFSHSSLTRDSKIKTIAAFLEQGALRSVSQDNENAGNAAVIKQKDLQKSFELKAQEQVSEGEFKNDCEALVRKLYPKVDKAINLLSQFGKAQMTGTGACAFVLLDSKQDAQAALSSLQNQTDESLKVILCKTVNQSPLHSDLTNLSKVS